MLYFVIQYSVVYFVSQHRSEHSAPLDKEQRREEVRIIGSLLPLLGTPAHKTRTRLLVPLQMKQNQVR